MTARAIRKKGIGITSPNPLEELLGDSYLDFLQTVYDRVLNSIAAQVKTAFTIRDLNEYLEYEDEAAREKHIEEPPYQINDRSYHKLSAAPQRQFLQAPVPSSQSRTINSLFTSLVGPADARYPDRGSSFSLSIRLAGSALEFIDPATSYLNDWVRLALFGLERLASIIKSDLGVQFEGLINNTYVVSFTRVVVTASNAAELESDIDPDSDPHLKVIVEVILSEAASLIPEGREYDEARSRFERRRGEQ